jgi:hypothetical protein
MKTLLRIPTNEQYAYIEHEFEGSADEAVEEYQRLTQLVKGGSGLPEKEFNGILDHYLSGEPFVGDEIMAQIEMMSAQQRWTMNAIKRSKARTK